MPTKVCLLIKLIHDSNPKIRLNYIIYLFQDDKEIKQLSGGQYEVLLTSIHESRNDMVHLTKKFCEVVKNKQMKTSDINSQLIQKNLCRTYFKGYFRGVNNVISG